MLRLLVSTVAGLALVGCSALESENFDLASLTAFNSEQEVSSQECKVLMDNRSVNIRSTSGATLRIGSKDCEASQQVVSSSSSAAMATISGDVAFDVGSANIKPGFAANLDALASQMLAREGSRFSIVGHTDNSGAEDYNQQLSERRAEAVADYLVGQGISAGALSILGLGESRPIADNATAEGQARNRRVEIFELNTDN